MVIDQRVGWLVLENSFWNGISDLNTSSCYVCAVMVSICKMLVTSLTFFYIHAFLSSKL